MRLSRSAARVPARVRRDRCDNQRRLIYFRLMLYGDRDELVSSRLMDHDLSEVRRFPGIRVVVDVQTRDQTLCASARRRGG